METSIAPPQQSAADLASSFLNSVGQELHGSADNAYGHESQGNESVKNVFGHHVYILCHRSLWRRFRLSWGQ